MVFRRKHAPKEKGDVDYNREKKSISKKTTVLWMSIILSTTLISVIIMSTLCSFAQEISLADPQVEEEVIGVEVVTESGPVSIQNETNSVAALKGFVDYSVDPCDNFYQHACGLWMQKQPNWNTREKELLKQQDKLLKDLLEGNPRPKTRYYEVIVDFMKKCVGEKPSNELKSLSEYFNSYKLKLLPLKNKDDRVDLFNLLKEVYNLDFSVFFDMSARISNVNYVEISSSQPFLGMEVYMSAQSSKIRQLLFETVKEMMQIFLTKAGIQMATDEQINEIMDFEQKWAEALKGAKSVDISTRPTIQHSEKQRGLRYLPSTLTWQHMVKGVFGIDNSAMANTHILSFDDQKIAATAAMFERTPKHVLVNYMFYRLLMHFGPSTDLEIFKPLKNLNEQLRSLGLPVELPMTIEDQCLSTAKDYFNEIVASYYIDTHYQTTHQQYLASIVSTLKSTFVSMIQGSSFLNKDSKTKVLRKIRKLRVVFGYTDKINTNTYLTQDANAVSADHILKTRTKVKHSSHRLRLTTKKDPSSVLIENIFTSGSTYFPHSDFLVIHLPVLGLYDSSSGNLLNFGGFGGFVAKQMLEILEIDQDGKNPSVISWMNTRDLEKFNSRRDCIAKGEEITTDTIYEHENVKLAFTSYKTYQIATRDNKRFPDHTLDKMFFLTYAQYYCVGNATASDVQRVNSPISKYDRFAQVYRCPAGSAMNPSKKCDLI